MGAQLPVLDYSQRGRSSGWLAGMTLLCGGVLAGMLLGMTITGFGAGTPPPPVGDPDAEKVPVIRVSRPVGMALAAGIGALLGLASARVARSHPLVLSLSASVLAAGSAVATIIILQWQRGRWRVGVIDGRTFAVAVALVVLVGGGALLAVGLSALARPTRQ
jgi:hypothetical protein